MDSLFKSARNLLANFWFKLIIAVLIIYYLFTAGTVTVGSLTSIKKNWGWLILAFGLMIPPYFVVSYRFMLILSSQGINVPFIQALRWTMIGSFFDLAMPSSNGGDIVKAGYLIAAVGPGGKTMAIMAIAFDRLIGILGLFILAFLASIIGWQMLAELPLRDLVVSFSLCAGVLPLIAFRFLGSRRLFNSKLVKNIDSLLGGRFRKIIKCFNAFREQPKKLFFAIGLSILNHIFWCTSLFFIAFALSGSVSIIKGFVVFPLAIFAGVFGFAGGFGVGTAAFDFLFSHFLLIKNGLLIGLTFQVFGAISRLLGLPFYFLKNHQNSLALSSNLDEVKYLEIKN